MTDHHRHQDRPSPTQGLLQPIPGQTSTGTRTDHRHHDRPPATSGQTTTDPRAGHRGHQARPPPPPGQTATATRTGQNRDQDRPPPALGQATIGSRTDHHGYPNRRTLYTRTDHRRLGFSAYSGTVRQPMSPPCSGVQLCSAPPATLLAKDTHRDKPAMYHNQQQ